MMDKLFYIGCTLALTVFGQLIMKARALVHTSDKAGGNKFDYLLAMYTDVGVLSGLGAAVLASIFWAMALERAGLGFAYPFMALSFVVVPLAASLLFDEAVSPMQFLGLIIIVVGVAINALAYKN